MKKYEFQDDCMNAGNGKLLILAFDHRGSFMSKMFGIKGNPTEEEAKTISDYKRIVYDGFVRAVGSRTEGKGILVDEQFGSQILTDAKKMGITFAMPCEKSGQDEFDFEYENFQQHIEKFSPSFIKVLVRLNPEGDAGMNSRQLARLKMLNDYLKQSGRKFLFELLVPASETQLNSAGDQASYDAEMRPGLMVKSMRIIQDAGVEPDIWKLEGVDRSEHSKALVKQAKAGARQAGIITLGRGESREKVAEWLKVGARIPGVMGFAVGRTIFWEPLEGYKNRKWNRDEAVRMIADNYSGFVHLWENEQNGP